MGVRGVGVNTDKIAGQRLSIWRGGPCDNRGLVNVLEEQYGITRYPPGRRPAKGVGSLPPRLACCRQGWAIQNTA